MTTPDPTGGGGSGPTGDIDMEVALHGRPTAFELVMAAREFLADEVLPATEGRVQFHTRVTIRVLDTVARQLERGRAQSVD
ncbi:MAG: hypothetical protein ACRDXE_04430, partial [Acidimicrobiales bacterium]